MFVFALLLHLRVRKSPEGRKNLRSSVSRRTQRRAVWGETTDTVREDREREREEEEEVTVPLLTHFHTLRER